MSMLVRWTPPALTAEQYDEAVGKLEAQGNWPPGGIDPGEPTFIEIHNIIKS